MISYLIEGTGIPGFSRSYSAIGAPQHISGEIASFAQIDGMFLFPEGGSAASVTKSAGSHSLDLQLFVRNIKKIDDTFLKKNGIIAYELKDEFVGGAISRYDLYANQDTGEILIYLTRW